jgi:hypothetical protein
MRDEMKVFNIEATNMGNNQQEIAEEVLNLVGHREYKSDDEFYEEEGALIAKACENLGWESAPQTGGLVVEWE